MATHNRAGEITYTQIGELTIRATITTYTRTSSFAADRDSLELFWGDGTSTIVPRSNGNGEELPNDIKVNRYTAEHSYPTRSQYKLSVTDPNRIAGIQNIDFPNSVNIQFYIETTLTLLDQRFQGENSSAILLQPPIDFACLGQPFLHNPNAFDADGDSLSYELIAPFQEEGVNVPNYSFPDEIAPGEDNQISINPETGDFIWESPQILGEFNLTILIKEYRNGFLINQIIRDMQILIAPCFDNNMEQNVAPQIESIDEICVIAGEKIEFDVIATDLDSLQFLTLSALGGPFIIDSNDVSFDQQLQTGLSPFKGTFVWNTDCSNISEEYYQVVFKAIDNFLGTNAGGAATLKTVRIKIVAPPPINVNTEKIDSETIRISWQSPYSCQNTDLFQGFSVWRRLNTRILAIDSCKGGLEGQGYEKIIFLTNENDNNQYFSIDIDLEGNNIYCYRVLGEFAQLTDNGNPYNQTASIPSNESCQQFERNAPLITKVSVLDTDDSDGRIEINWSLPSPDEIDTIASNGPFGFRLLRSIGADNTDLTLVEESVVIKEEFNSLRADTSYIDLGLNTEQNIYNYRVEFFVGNNLINSSNTASSLFLIAIGRDHNVELKWRSSVPWTEIFYNIYHDSNDELIFLNQVTGDNFIIPDLPNGIEQCYVIESVSTYGLDNIIDPILNTSQIACAIPTDSIPPCPPVLTVTTECQQSILINESFTNEITWSYSDLSCSNSGDTKNISILYSLSEQEELREIDMVSLSDNIFFHEITNNISGCYALVGIDSSGNRSERSSVICVDNCPSYRLPNAFTPNDDNNNDLYVPIINRFIERVEFEVYNRWGQIVFDTDDPAIQWDGTNYGGQQLADGTYYFTCRVFERRVSGIEEQVEPLNGYIQIITGN